LQVLGGLEISVDGRGIDFARTLNYKGMMYSDVPNMAFDIRLHQRVVTLKCDLTCEYVCRLINYMDRAAATGSACRAISTQHHRTAVAGFFVRLCAALDRKMPNRARSGRGGLYQNYALDIGHAAVRQVDDGVMQYREGQGLLDFAGSKIRRSANRIVRMGIGGCL